MSSQQTQTALSMMEGASLETPREQLALVLLWSRSEPQRVGEILLLPRVNPRQGLCIGRGPAEPGMQMLELYRQRPGRLEPRGPILSPRVSRIALKVRIHPQDRLQLENVGKLPLLHHGQEVSQVELQPGELVELKHELVLGVIQRLPVLPSPPELASLGTHPFGEADKLGLVGESAAAWDLRRQVAFAGPRNAHALLLGSSGTGKELVAGALHALSPRSARTMVARNAATFPETLIDAELFGNAKSFPNVGMPERPGLVGEADGSTLFLDEIGELPSSLQAHLLRVLDQGEYQRLGESRMRKADLRLIAATNRSPEEMKHDVVARLKLRIQLPDLNSRREDVPLIARHLMRRIAASDPLIAERFMEGKAPAWEPRFTPSLMAALVQHPYTTHVRELEALLWQSMTGSTGSFLEKVEGMSVGKKAELRTPERAREPEQREKSAPEPVRPRVPAVELTPEVIQACLDKHQGVQDRVWPELGLANRFALYRLIKKYNLSVKRSDENEEDEPEPS